MNKMMNPEMEVVRFGAEDVIATSADALHARFIAADADGYPVGRIVTANGTFVGGLHDGKDDVTGEDVHTGKTTVAGFTDYMWNDTMESWTQGGSQDGEILDFMPEFAGLNLEALQANPGKWFRQWENGTWTICNDGFHTN